MDPQRALQKARAQLVLRQPFIAAIALGLDLVEDSTCNGGWTDGFRIGYNPEWVLSLRPEQVEFFLAHEVYHVVLAHHLRRCGREAKRWNVAGNHVINLLLVEAGLTPFPGFLGSTRYVGLSTDEVYKRLPSSEEGDGAQSAAGEGESMGDGLAADIGEVRDGAAAFEDESMGDGFAPDFGEVRDATSRGGGALTEAERRKRERTLKVRVAQMRNQEAALRRYGVGSGGTKRVALECLRPEIDWRLALQNFVATVRTRDDYTWHRPNPRYLQQGLYLPLLQTETLGDLVVVVDTSGSISQKLLNRFASELESILAMFPHSGIHLLGCDAEIHTTEFVTAQDSPLRLEMQGGGGTSFVRPFEWVEEEDVQTVGLVYFTDLEGPFPQVEPDYPVLWLNYGVRKKRAPFGETVMVRES